MTSAEPSSANALLASVQALITWPLEAAPKRVFDSASATAGFAVVVYSHPDPTLQLEEGTVPADNVAAVIDDVEILDAATLREAYLRVVAAKKLDKLPPPDVGDHPVSASLLGVIHGRRASLTVEAIAAELEHLNGETSSEFWPDIVVIEGVGLFQYGVQFPGTSVKGTYLPPARGVTRDTPPPMYIPLLFHPAGTSTFKVMAHTLCGHLTFFSPGAKLPDLGELREGVPDAVIVEAPYQYNLAGELVPVPREFYNDRYLPVPPLQIEAPNGEPLATIERVPWQDGGVILLRGKLPLEGLLVFLGEASRKTVKTVKPEDDGDLQLSYVLPLSHAQFTDFPTEFQRRSNMVVRPSKGRLIAQTVANEGTSTPFMARLLLGVMRVRDAAYPEPSARKSFDELYESVSHSLMGARDAAREIERLWEGHTQKLAKGETIRRQGNALHIGDGIDRELKREVETFLNTSVRCLKHGLQKLTAELGVDVSFWFKKQQAFSRGLVQLRSTDAALADYIAVARAEWSEALISRRNAIEHEGWALSRVAYEEQGDIVIAHEPTVDGRSVREYTDFMLDRLCRAVEEVTAHLLNLRLRTKGVCLHEVPLAERRPEIVERFRITAASGGEPCWSLSYSTARFEDV